MKKRVVITGLGAVTPLGNDLETTWMAVKKGRSGIGPLTRRNPLLFPVKVAAEVKDFDVSLYIDPKEAKKMDRFTQFAVVAALQAVEDANLMIGENAEAERVGIWIGSGIGGMETYEEN